MAIVYMAVNTADNMIYIGRSIHSLHVRKTQHIRQACTGNTYFNKVLCKHKDAIEWDVLEEVPDNEVNNAEMFWIAYYKSIGARLYNHTIGGTSMIGYKHTKERKQKISEKMLGRKPALHTHMAAAAAQAKTYVVISPDGETVEVYNLTDFCKRHGFSKGSFHAMLSGKAKSAYGYKLPNT